MLVTDAVAWRRGAVGPVALSMRDGAPRLADGTLAGSALTMDAAVRTCVGAGIDLADALHAASAHPAAALGSSDRGAIATGRRADLVALRPDLTVEQTWVAGVPTL
jgi:N-acetylglucosamine-6-phosphate deacetylase